MSVLSKEQHQQWAEHIQAWRDSGLSQQDYCQEHGLKSHQFWYWKRKLSGPTQPETDKAQDSQPNTANRLRKGVKSCNISLIVSIRPQGMGEN